MINVFKSHRLFEGDDLTEQDSRQSDLHGNNANRRLIVFPIFKDTTFK